MRIVVKVANELGEYMGIGHSGVHHFSGGVDGDLIVYGKKARSIKVLEIYPPDGWVSVAVTDKQELVD